MNYRLINSKKLIKKSLIPIFCLIGIFIFGNFVFAATPGDVVINEIAWMGTKSSSNDEWIELYNTTEESIDLTGWTLISITDGSPNIVLKGFIDPLRFFLLERTDDSTISDVLADQIYTGILSQTAEKPGEKLELRDPQGNLMDSLDCSNGWFAGKASPDYISMERIDPKGLGDDSDNWADNDGVTINGLNAENRPIQGTPKARNSVYLIFENKEDKDENLEDLEDEEENQSGVFSSDESTNHPPIADAGDDLEIFTGVEIEFDASDSYDSDGDELIFSWDFGDGTQESGVEANHIYLESGQYIVTLEVSDGNFKNVDSLTVTVREFDYSDDIIINEFLPNPEGKDSAAAPTGEWIELFNQGEDDVDLGGWQIDDLKDGGSKPFIIPHNIIIKRGEYLVFYYEKTKVALNNNGDEISLINPKGDLLDFISYSEKVSEGSSFSRADDGTWVWTDVLTPGKRNIIFEEEKETNKEKENYEKNEKKNLSSNNSSDNPDVLESEKGKSKENPIEISINETRSLSKGTWVKVEGVVSVPPQVLGKKIFYLAGSGIQIYFFKEDFPDLELGDLVSIIGKMSEQGGEKKINLESRDDIELIDSGNTSEPEIISTGDMNEVMVGSLVSVEGEVVKTSGNVFYLDDGTGEIKIYIRATTGIEKPKMKKGDWVSIVGIASKTSSGYRILPRFQDDIKLGRVAGIATLPSAGADLAVVCLTTLFVMSCGVYLELKRENFLKNNKGTSF